MKIEQLTSFPPKDNPFHHDLYHMGQRMGTNVVVMFENHPTAKMDYLIVVNTETGERARVIINDVETMQFKAKQFKAKMSEGGDIRYLGVEGDHGLRPNTFIDRPILSDDVYGGEKQGNDTH